MLVIVNPYATTVSDRLRNLVVYALGSRYAVEAIDTQERGHAVQICREAAIEGYDVVDATEHLLRMADDFEPFRVDVGLMNERYFVFAAGAGLDASVVERVDAHPYRKARFGAWYYSVCAVDIFMRRYLVHPPRVRVIAGDRVQEGVTAVVQNSDPFTYFRNRPIRVVEPAGLGQGSLSIGVLKRATALELPTLIPRLLSARARSVMRHRQ